MRGESVAVPLLICQMAYLAIPMFLPWLVSLPVIRHRGLRLYYLFFLFAALMVWYFAFGFDQVFDKAYRRGL